MLGVVASYRCLSVLWRFAHFTCHMLGVGHVSVMSTAAHPLRVVGPGIPKPWIVCFYELLCITSCPELIIPVWMVLATRVSVALFYLSFCSLLPVLRLPSQKYLVQNTRNRRFDAFKH